MDFNLKKQIGRVLAVSGLLAFALACSQTDPKLSPPPKEVKKPQSQKADFVSIFPPVDILFVVDDSGSMGSHQDNLAKNVGLFVQQIFNSTMIDYHIGVITTSIDYSSSKSDNGKLNGVPKFVHRGTPNALDALKANLVVGTSGDSSEKFFDPLFKALTEPNLSIANRRFLRPNAHLAIVIVTDTEDQSTAHDAQMTYDLIVNTLKGGRRNMVSVYAAYVPSVNPTNCSRDDGPPVRLEEFFQLAGAKTFILCDPTFGKQLAALGNDLFNRIMETVYLSRVPQVNTIKVSYGSQEIQEDAENGWVYDPTRVALRFGPKLVWSEQPAGTGLDVSFVPIED